VVVAALLLWTGNAAAQPDALDLAWSGAAGCPSEDDVRARITAAADGAELGGALVTVVAQRAGRAWRAVVDVAGERRILAGASCDEVASAVALVIALALRREHEDAEERGEETAVAPVRAPEPVAEALRVDGAAAAGRSLVRFAAAAEAGAELGTLPAIAAVVSGGAGMRWRTIGVWLGASYATSGAPAQPDGEFASARVTRIAGYGRACATVAVVSVCGGAEAGRMAATVASAEDRDAGSGLWVAAVAGAAFAIPLGRTVELGLGSDLVLPLAYPRFSVNGIDRLDTPGVVGGRIGTSLRIHFR
jgi:hypothetical protein